MNAPTRPPLQFGLGSLLAVAVLVLIVAYGGACALMALGTEVRFAREAARRTQCNNHLTIYAGCLTPEEVAEFRATGARDTTRRGTSLKGAVPCRDNDAAIEVEQMEAALARLEAWLAGNAPALRELLNPPATAADIAAFEARTSLVLPPPLRRLYTVHDGEADGSDGIFGCRRWLPLRIVAEEVELIGSEDIVPFLRSGGGDLWYVRCQTGAEADQRVYEWWHEVPAEANVVAESLEAWLAEFVARLESGGYVYRPEELAALIDRRDLVEE